MPSVIRSIVKSCTELKTFLSTTPKAGRRGFIAAALLMASIGMSAGPASFADDRSADTARHQSWVGTWTASPQTPEGTTPVATFNNQTVRQIIHTHTAGNKVRVRLSNELGTEPLVIGEAHIARQQSEANIMPATDRTLTFGGQRNVMIPAGAPAVSDPIDLDVPAGANLVVSLYLPNATTARTVHSLGVQTNYISRTGNFTNAATFTAETTAQAYYFLTGVSVESSARVLVTLGDSITDGYGATVGANRRWPDVLAARLNARGGKNQIAVLNQGISGNRLLYNNTGPNALARFDRDVLAQAGVDFVIVLEGINDIGQPGSFQPASESVTADQIIAAHRQMIARAHQNGIRIFGATLTPFEGTIFVGYFTPAGEEKRQIVNNWIRNSGEFDAVIDFDRVLRDPARPARMLPQYDVGDHLHPNDAGYLAMANAIDLSLFNADRYSVRKEATELRSELQSIAR